MYHRSFSQRVLLAVFGCLAAVVLVGSPLVTHPAKAQLPVLVAEDIPQKTDSIITMILKQLSQAAVTAFFNAARSFAGQVAFDAANYVASGGTGQGALAYNKGFGSYLKNVGGDAAGEFIGSLSNDFFEKAGLDLCRPPNPTQLLNLQLSIGNLGIPGINSGETARPKPRCDFQDIVSSYKEIYTSLTNVEITNNVSLSLNPNSSDLGISSAIFGRADINIADAISSAAQDRQEGQGIRPVTGRVDGAIRTPSATVRDQITQQIVTQPAETETASFSATMSTAFEQGFVQLASYTASMFINTLSNKMLKRVMEKGILGAFDFSTAKVGVTSSPDSISVRGKTDSRKANIDLKNVSLLRVSDVEINSELIACPDNRGLWNCTADESLAQLILGKTAEGNPTIRLAMEQSMLKGEWRLIPTSDVRNNQDRNCYKQAYCAGNLQKLRAMRILPVGFEFAANSTENVARCAGADGCVTLKEVVDGYASCNTDGKRDATHPWCNLIDPNWIVTSFQQQCQLTGYGDTLLSSSLGQRREECRDIQTCLRRDDAGECVGGYGYCVAEKNVYRFNAEECKEDFASCRTYTDRGGQTASYLRNTLDNAVCRTENVGCMSYATARNADGVWSETSPKMYFDKTLEPCAATNEGCTKLLSSEVGQSALNLLRNPSFETAMGSPLALEAWRRSDVAPFVLPTVSTGDLSLDGTASLGLSAGFAYQQNVEIVPLRIYTISAWVRANGEHPAIEVRLNQFDSAGISPSSEIGLAYKSAGCGSSPKILKSGSELDNNWTRYECSFLAVASTRSATFDIVGTDALVDAVQLEEGQFATNFITGSNRSLSVLHMKVAPDDLSCTGAASDASSCSDFAKSCRQVDAGCQGYTDKVGGPEVPAILSANDICPQECVGYAEFRKQPAAFDLVNDPDTRFSDAADATSSYFIPSTARQCTQAQVGCEAFTNMGSSANGGEQSSSWSYLRTCHLPDATKTKTFFTWEGSESAGYQLRTFSLMADTTAPSGLKPPQVLAKRAPDGAFKEPSTCNEELWRTGVDPDCRQFYDAAGNVFYSYYSQTVLSTDDCVNLRITRATNFNDCSKTGGEFNITTSECFYSAFIGESRSCPASAASCRAYSGTTAGNTQVLVNENFRNGKGGFSTGTVSTESLLVGDQSLRLEKTASADGGTSVDFSSTPDGLYRVSFWAKGIGVSEGLEFGMRDAATPSVMPSAIGAPIHLSADWQRYTVGLFSGAAGTDATTFGMRPTAVGAVFIDEVRIERVRDTAFVIENSWNTPNSCDRSFAGAVEPQAMLGCRAYNDRFNREVNAFRFTSLCHAEGIGCRAFVDTRNSDGAYSENFNQHDASPVPVYNPAVPPATTVYFGASTTTRPADRMLYLVYDPSKVCQLENASCRAFGKPRYSIDRSTIESYDTVYYKDDITKYGDALCKPSEEFCEEFSYNGSSDYFRNPGSKVCEYRTAVRLPATTSYEEGEYSGWFQKGAIGDTPCYPETLIDGHSFGLPKRGDRVWSGWTGACPATATECTEFRDVNDTSDTLHRSGKPYFFINDEKIDRTSCAGNVDLGQGCVLMREMTNPVLNYSVAASYRKYNSNDFRPTQPIDCSRDFADPACQSTTSTDANILVKIKVDRDCAQWLGCKSSESVFDPATSQHKEICTNVALCDKSTGKPGEIFCANYVDRSATSTEAVMQAGKFFDINTYTERPVGLGTKDYSGYAMPNAFQISELVTARVGVEGAKNVDNNDNRFALDYRLAASVLIPVVTGFPLTFKADPGINDARILDSTPIGEANRTLNLCQHIGSGIIGYYLDTEVSVLGRPLTPVVHCYLPVKYGGDNYNFQNVSSRFSLADPRTDAALTNAYPPAECRANPESDSPFGASYVTEWDMTTNPPKAKTKVGGFISSNTCEFGEDCSCNYKRANFGSTASSKFYAPLSQNVPPGICQGGPRDGESCLPSTIFSLPTQTTSGSGATALAGAVEGSNASQTCGPVEGGGRCVAFNKLEIIKGIFGQCLERDETRVIGDDQSNKPCLTWNPTPILFGDKDSFHYQPTSGYMPPQNSGQYYCVSPVKQAVKTRMNYQSFEPASEPADDSNQSGGKFAGSMTKITYRDQWVSSDNNGIFTEDRNFYASIFGASPFSYYTATHDCEYADDDQDDSGGSASNGTDAHGIRLVDAGSGYGEYFLRVSDKGLADQLQLDSSEPDKALTDNSISYFKIDPISGPNGRIACGYQASWVDGMGKINYDDLASSKPADATWRKKFYENYKPYLTRGNEDVLTVKGNDAEPRKVKCAVDAGDCYMKYWESDYRTGDSTKFIGLQVNDEGRNDDASKSLRDIRVKPVQKTCSTNKPYFAIRAVFESPTTNSSVPTAPATLTKDKVDGPWRFVGFWVSACGGDTGGDQRYIYMNMEVGSASVCKEVAEVRSVNAGQDAAFTDRVWSKGDFREPGTGIQYSDNASPFSSALNTGPAGADPLIMSGSEITGFSPLNPPIWLAPPSQSYYRNNQFPQNKWSYLSNLFARIYRVYRYEYLPVSKIDTACLEGPFKGARCSAETPSESIGRCVNNDGSTNHNTCTSIGMHTAVSEGGCGGYALCVEVVAGAVPQTACSYDGTCQKLLTADENKALKVCKVGISGANNISCVDSDDACKAPTFVSIGGTTLKPLVNSCVLREESGWTKTAAGLYTKPSMTEPVTEEIAGNAANNAFKCDTNVGPNVGEARGSAPLALGMNRVTISPSSNTYAFSTVVPVTITVEGAFTGIRYTIDGTDPGCAGGIEYTGPFTVTLPASSGRLAVKAWACGGVIGTSNVATYTASASPSAVVVPSVDRPCSAPSDASFGCPVKIEGRTCQTSRLKCSAIASTDPNIHLNVAGITPAETENACVDSADCNFSAVPGETGAALCGVSETGWFGRCVGGIRDGEICKQDVTSAGDILSCISAVTATAKTAANASCGFVSTQTATGFASSFDPVPQCRKPGATSGPNTSDNPDADNNICTHSAGYQPRLDMCPDPSDEYCGLIAYKITDTSADGSLAPASTFPLPTDHTLGMYTPTYLGLPGIDAATFKYMAYYTPQPPRLAAPDIRNCPVPGQCPITRTDAFSFNGQTDGVISVGGGTQKSTLRFYAWAAHNQMPLRQVVIDWGDNSKQRVDDTRMKNRKPFCGVQRECSLVPGLTCQTNSDCPAGTGTCANLGTCAQNQNLTCSQDSDCSVGGIKDTCTIRTMFGNSTEACQSDYYDFSHLYTCGAQQTADEAEGGLKRCSTSPHCSRDTNRSCTTPGSTNECAPGDTCLEGLAPVDGCFDTDLRTCRFTPRVMIQDNFGWCTGECRASTTGGQPDDASSVTVRHPNGGCWAGATLGSESNIRTNDKASLVNRDGNTVLNLDARECQESWPGIPTDPVSGVPDPRANRPWIVYPGSLQLRENGEIVR